jgi:hypothetical protein
VKLIIQVSDRNTDRLVHIHALLKLNNGLVMLKADWYWLNAQDCRLKKKIESLKPALVSLGKTLWTHPQVREMPAWTLLFKVLKRKSLTTINSSQL